jgi:hypothetical protein
MKTWIHLGALVAAILASAPGVARPSPPLPALISRPAGLDVLWAPQPGTGSLYVYTVPNDDRNGTLNLPAKRRSAPGVPDEAAVCTWDAQTPDCITCPDDGARYYLDAEAIRRRGRVRVDTVAASAGILRLGGLSPRHRYAVFLQDAPRGAVSDCTESFAALPSAKPASAPTALQAEVDARLAEFYAPGSGPDVMARVPPKFDAVTGRIAHPNGALRLPDAAADQTLPPLARAAQAKATPAFREAACALGERARFARPPCLSAEKSAYLDNDDVSDLVGDWIDDARLVRDLTRLPRAATAARIPWSDDYWRMRWGGLSYRYESDAEYPTYREAVAAYAQPSAWRRLGRPDSARTRAVVTTWSPAEKYDIATGDVAAFSLTNEQKSQGEGALVRGNVPDWYGICDGWAAASLSVPRPERPLTSRGAQGAAVQWYPADVRALSSLAWARGSYRAVSIGSRCNAVAPETYPNGRLSSQSCFDNNPAAFTLALGNLIGGVRQSFIMESSFDAEVWNQPVIGYELVYFNPLAPDRRSTDWSAVAVPYDAAFKAVDRFQSPLTRGVRRRGVYDDGAVQKVVGVIAYVTYLSEYIPWADPTPAEDERLTVAYTYDLELSPRNGRLVVTGGEWQSNIHPDFIWRPRRDAQLHLAGPAVDYDTARVPSVDVTTTAADVSSEHGSPLCSVLNQLVRASAGVNGRACAD